MSAGEWIGVASVAAAIVALFLAGIANGRAKAANDISVNALKEAREADKIAEDANRLSDEANKTIRREVNFQEETSVVDWELKWDKARGELAVKNVGRDEARNVAIVVTANDFHHVEPEEHAIPAGESIPVALQELVELRTTHNVEKNKTYNRLNQSGIFYSGRAFARQATVTISWRTGEGFPEKKILDKTLT